MTTAASAFQLRPETFGLVLTLGGRAAGEMNWSVTPDKHVWVARVQTDFGGVLPDVRRVQVSRVQPRDLTSLGYAEGDGKRATFETEVDRRGGVLTLRQGRDEASEPLTADVHDPVSVLLWLRALKLEEGGRAEVRMVGGRVYVRRLPDAGISGIPARGYELRPGGALVYVERDSPHRLLRLVQPTDFGPVVAELPGERAPGRVDSRADGGRRRKGR